MGPRPPALLIPHTVPAPGPHARHCHSFSNATIRNPAASACP